MGTVEIEALAAALEACAAELELRGSAGGAFAPQGGSLPRLRRPTGIPGAPGPRGFAPPAHLDTTDTVLQDVRELAAEFHDVAQEVRAGNAGRGWVNSLVGRASRYLDEAQLADVQAAARSCF